MFVSTCIVGLPSSPCSHHGTSHEPPVQREPSRWSMSATSAPSCDAAGCRGWPTAEGTRRADDSGNADMLWNVEVERGQLGDVATRRSRFVEAIVCPHSGSLACSSGASAGARNRLSPNRVWPTLFLWLRLPALSHPRRSSPSFARRFARSRLPTQRRSPHVA